MVSFNFRFKKNLRIFLFLLIIFTLIGVCYSALTSSFGVSGTVKVPSAVYTLTYNANGGSVNPTSKSVTLTGAYGTLATPTRTGYTFNGWYTSSSGGAQVSSSTVHNVTSNVTIYAHWNLNSYAVTVSGNKGLISHTNLSVSYGGSANVTVTPNDGYYLSSFTCTNGYTVSGITTGINATETQNAVISNNNATQGSSCTAVFAVSCTYEIGYSWSYNYTGSIENFIAPCNGTYKLEAYGAEGGSTQVSKGGLGGYAVGNTSLRKNDTLYLAVGGKGGNAVPNSSAGSAAGYNGAGSGTSKNITSSNQGYGAGGGGATHIGTLNALLPEYTSKTQLLLVAGGGGGAAAVYGWYSDGTPVHSGNAGGAGGGLTGGSGLGSTTQLGTGGSQYEGGTNSIASQAIRNGSFGQGGSWDAGGGGGFYGGGSGYWQSSAGGGSSYIDPLKESSTTSGLREGNGYAKITLLSYDIENSLIGTKWQFSYTGAQDQFVIPYSGVYTIEVFGPNGGVGSYLNDKGGGFITDFSLDQMYGGYTKADFSFASGTNLYILVGGQGARGSTADSASPISAYNGAGGYNGGTLGTQGGGGSGAVHVATKAGLTSALSSSDIYISAKGGDGQRVLNYIEQELSGGKGYGSNYISSLGTNQTIDINKQTVAGYVVITLKSLN